LPRKKWEDHFEHYNVIDSLQRFIDSNSQISILLGASTYARAEEGEPLMSGARAFLDDSTAFYYAFNTALMFTSKKEIQTYHKSVLVPGVEQMPFPKLMKPLEKFAINLGGTTGSLGVSKTQHTLNDNSQEVRTAPIICYESIYGGFVGNFVRNGANLLAIITNDGWWGNTPGYKQHFEYAHLRAIEYRRDIVRSANTGKSAFFNQKGDAVQTTNYWEPAAIKKNVRLNTQLTYYAEKGDYLANIALFVSSLLILIFISVSLRGKIKSVSE
jgi:apolipoprotein N-acyltransferase